MTAAQWLLSGALAVAGWSVLAAAAPPALYPDRDYDTGLGRINSLAYSSDGRLLVAGGARGYGVWDGQTGNEIRKSLDGPVQRVAVGAGGTVVALGAADGRVTVVDLRAATPREVVRHPKPVTSLAFNADGRVGASGDADGGLMIWDPTQGPATPLRDGGHREDILLLSFAANGQLLSASKDLRVVTWDVSGKRPVRRGSLRSETSGRAVVPADAAADAEGASMVLTTQLVTEARGGFLSDRAGPARPGDQQRANALLPYVTGTGMTGDAISTADFRGERIAVSPAGCFAFYTSLFRNQPRLHVWGLLERGDDLVRIDTPAAATALALEPGGRAVALGGDTGRVMTWRVSGATRPDCDAFRRDKAPAQSLVAEAKITPGPETDPLIAAENGEKLAVLQFETTGVDTTLGSGVSEMVAGELSNRPGIVVIERSAIESILRELQIQRSGLTTADAVRVGRGLNARRVLLGSVRRFGEDTFIILVRTVDVETQQVQGSREVACEHCKEQDLPRAVAALRRLIVR
jgi:TolB-like protein